MSKRTQKMFQEDLFAPVTIKNVFKLQVPVLDSFVKYGVVIYCTATDRYLYTKNNESYTFQLLMKGYSVKSEIWDNEKEVLDACIKNYDSYVKWGKKNDFKVTRRLHRKLKSVSPKTKLSDNRWSYPFIMKYGLSNDDYIDRLVTVDKYLFKTDYYVTDITVDDDKTAYKIFVVDSENDVHIKDSLICDYKWMMFIKDNKLICITDYLFPMRNKKKDTPNCFWSGMNIEMRRNVWYNHQRYVSEISKLNGQDCNNDQRFISLI